MDQRETRGGKHHQRIKASWPLWSCFMSSKYRAELQHFFMYQTKHLFTYLVTQYKIGKMGINQNGHKAKLKIQILLNYLQTKTDI